MRSTKARTAAQAATLIFIIALACQPLTGFATTANATEPGIVPDTGETQTSEGEIKKPDTDETAWYRNLGRLARNSLVDMEDYADVAWAKFARRMGMNEPRHIANYSGYGNADHVWVTGRLLANTPYGGPMDDDDWFDNLQATYGRWNSKEIADAPVVLAYNGATQVVHTDEEGYYHGSFERAGQINATDRVLAEYRGTDGEPISALHTVYGTTQKSQLLIISDMDDTVIHTGITDLLLAAQLTFLNNAKTRKPLAGVGALYRNLRAGVSGDEKNPVFYVSNSAWNMYDLLRDFVDLNDIPPGPLMLRDIGFHKEGEGTENHKADTIRQILSRFAPLPAILVGDSGQHDADIYRRISAEFPGRIEAIYIRDVDPDSESAFDSSVDAIISESSGGGVPFLRVADSSLIAEHAQSLGLLSAEQVRQIDAETHTDKGRESVTEELLEETLALDSKE